MIPLLSLLCMVSAPVPVARLPKYQGPPFQIGAILDATWQFTDDSPPTKWMCRFEIDGTYLGYMGNSAYEGTWEWDGKDTLIIHERNIKSVSAESRAVYTIKLNRNGRGYAGNGSVIRMRD